MIPPDDMPLDREAWRAIVALRRDLSAGALDPEDLEARPDGGAATDQAGSRTLRNSIREEYGLPNELSDDEAAAALEDALDAVVDGEFEQASDRLAEGFPSVCIRDVPSLDEIDDGHVVACHLYE